MRGVSGQKPGVSSESKVLGYSTERARDGKKFEHNKPEDLSSEHRQLMADS